MILPVNADLTIPDDAKCQEASPLSRSDYVACGRPAAAIIDNGDSRPYYMCLGCAAHNVLNRGATCLASKDAEAFERWKQIRELIPASGEFVSQGGSFPGWCSNCGKHRSLHRENTPRGACPR